MEKSPRLDKNKEQTPRKRHIETLKIMVKSLAVGVPAGAILNLAYIGAKSVTGLELDPGIDRFVQSFLIGLPTSFASLKFLRREREGKNQ